MKNSIIIILVFVSVFASGQIFAQQNNQEPTVLKQQNPVTANQTNTNTETPTVLKTQNPNYKPENSNGPIITTTVKTVMPAKNPEE